MTEPKSLFVYLTEPCEWPGDPNWIPDILKGEPLTRISVFCALLWLSKLSMGQSEGPYSRFGGSLKRRSLDEDRWLLYVQAYVDGYCSALPEESNLLEELQALEIARIRNKPPVESYVAPLMKVVYSDRSKG